MGLNQRVVALGIWMVALSAQAGSLCPRPAAGSVVREPPTLRSQHGTLRAQLEYRTEVDEAGRTLYCYVTPDGLQSPTFRLQPGDHLMLSVTNRVPESHEMEMLVPGPRCGAQVMTASSVNVHFHGTNTAPSCHQDEVIRTVINSGETFEYDLQIPSDEPPGLYWYHPHIHGIAEPAVQGGASGAIVIEGLEKLQPAVAGLAERIFVLRDNLVAGGPTPGGSVPSWDLSLNYVPIAYPELKPAVIDLRPGERQLWRFVNASADSIANLELRYDGLPQPLEVVALDGVPTGSQDGSRKGKILRREQLLLAPAARAEFIVTAPGQGVRVAELRTLAIDTGPGGDSDPLRVLARVRSSGEAPASANSPASPPNTALELGRQRFEGLDRAKVSRQRLLYFSEVLSNPADPSSPTNFYITEDGHTPVLFDPQNGPAITTTQGAVEEWTIQNRTQELHEFHIHQIHFLLLEKNGVPVPAGERQYLDTLQVPYWSGKGAYPSVKVRMDFRGPVVGEFPYHCHILGHEDNGMMATIRVLPAAGR